MALTVHFLKVLEMHPGDKCLSKGRVSITPGLFSGLKFSGKQNFWPLLIFSSPQFQGHFLLLYDIKSNLIVREFTAAQCLVLQMKCDEKCCWLATVIHSFLFPVEQHLIFVSYLSVLFFVEDYLFNGKTNHKSFSLQPNLIDCTILYFEMFVILCASDCLCIKPIMTSCCRCFKTHKYMCGSLKLCLEKKWVVYVSGSKV